MRKKASLTQRTRSSSRRCESCGTSYYRRNVLEAWTERNPGHRAGWNKSVRKTCLTCTSAKVANMVMMVIDTRAGATVRRGKKEVA